MILILCSKYTLKSNRFGSKMTRLFWHLNFKLLNLVMVMLIVVMVVVVVVMVAMLVVVWLQMF